MEKFEKPPIKRIFISSHITKEAIKEIAKCYNRSKTAQELGDEFGVSKQRVQQIAIRLRKNGVLIPIKKIYEIEIDKAISELKQDNPELFNP